ncbi:hypothetical protein CEP54_000232 [Fusarium duplospermum]|uniref:NmrA-like domain-containing protein n=1 Tax=Fusarium duplospermum TaxID=1325734 RepID=A0A428R8N3_9HYPO|nr:hypothetical protein CEP54_000232 [Fusarium duplospermum]
MKVAILGATGETGTSIVNGLLGSKEPRYEVTALIRKSSLKNPQVLALQAKGVKVVEADLSAPEDALETPPCAASLLTQIPLVNAAKAAGVKRFLPCCFAPVMPPEGVLQLRDTKEHVINHIKKVRLPYTIVDVGFWYQLMLPRLSSGRIDYALPVTLGGIAGDGNTPCAFTDLQDVGRWIARIIADTRTLNKMVFAYNSVLTMNQVYDMSEEASGERIDRNYISAVEIKTGVDKSEASTPSPNSFNYFEVVKYQYFNSMGLRGDNTPEYARYLGYLEATELYPGMKVTTPKAFCQEVLSGKAVTIYQRLASAAQ